MAKKESGPYWPRLLKQTGKFHFLKTDFSKWKDEDEEDEEVDNNGMNNPAMDLMGGNDFSNFDFSKFAGAGGMGGAEDAQFDDSDDE